MAYKYEGFWRAMDTLRDRQVLEEMVERGDMPWRHMLGAPRAAICRGVLSPERRSEGMRPLQLAAAGDQLSVLCLGAHSDDIEIGAGATLLSMIARGVRLDVHWCVLSGVGERGTRPGFSGGVPVRGGERKGRSDGLSRRILSRAGRGHQVMVRGR